MHAPQLARRMRPFPGAALRCAMTNRDKVIDRDDTEKLSK